MRLIRARTPIAKADDLDILSAVWILACIDENPILTYRGITARLGLAKDFDVRALILSRSELFRPGVTSVRLNKWKELMMKGKKRPAWMDEIKTEAERKQTIQGLSKEDVFRSQFRAVEGAPKSDLEIIDWGLNHIERLRKSSSEERQEKSQRRATWISFGSLVVAGLAIMSSWMSMREQRELKQYEVSFKPKQEAYSTFMSSFTKATLAAVAREQANVLTELNKMESSYFLFEPFLPREKRSELIKKFGEFTALCREKVKSTNAGAGDDSYKAFVDQITPYRVYFQNEIYDDLFKPN